VLIPPAVADELRAAGPGNAPCDPAAFPFFEVRAPHDIELVQFLGKRLDLGESEALALAVEVTPDVVLIGEKSGRAIAKELGLVPLGVLGVLVNAKRTGLTVAVAPLVTRLRNELDFYVSAEVERRILKLAGE
jgi:hypothetical protein